MKQLLSLLVFCALFNTLSAQDYFPFLRSNISYFEGQNSKIYTLKIKDGARNNLQKFLESNKIPSMIYYPVPLYKQPAFKNYVKQDFQISNVENLCNEVISIPIHTEINLDHMRFICDKINQF
jgi:dTDP-4-amino-4,6-dideoxygalactose transaminase